MVVKPAALTPLSALEIGRAFAEAGLPEGVLSVITSAKATAIGDAIMADDRVRVVSFTGSTEVGKILMRGAANTMKRVSLELGGHAPFIVFEDADMDHAIEQALATKMRNMGQTCVSANRFYVQRSIAMEFSERFAARILAMRIGHGNQPGTEVGPLVDAAAVEKVEQHVQDAVAKGATILIGGKRSTGADFEKGNFYEPTILMGVNDSMIVTYEETFGPVAPIIEFEDEDDAVRQANNSPFGLSAYFFTRDINRITRVSEALDYGTVGINDGAISAVQAPFGGVKESGIGREGGHMGMEEYLDVKYMSIGGLTANQAGA
jgi:succinate-semialdehyde dehydrogenase/glutarate-semialdehyde dehydrogenase